MEKDKTEKYRLSGYCVNCGHSQMIEILIGYERQRVVTCNACGCETMKPTIGLK